MNRLPVEKLLVLIVLIRRKSLDERPLSRDVFTGPLEDTREQLFGDSVSHLPRLSRRWS